MGICLSAPEDETRTPYHGEARPRGAHSSTYPQVLDLNSDATQADQRQSRVLTRSGNRPLAPRHAYAWQSEKPRLTRAALEHERAAFWDTAPAYEGRPEIWQALHLVCTADSRRLAQTIVDSAQISVPTGRLNDGCYDILGNRYVVPLYCLNDPSNLLPDSDGADDHTILAPENQSIKSSTSPRLGSLATSSSLDFETTAPGSIPTGSSSYRHREKLPSDTRSAASHQASSPLALPTAATQLTVRLSTGRDVKVPLAPGDTMLTVKAHLCELESLDPQRTTVRFFLLGKPVAETTQPLHDQQLLAARLIQALIAS
ncbi:hypothetical protein IWQ60_006898 [Tieghemiomyces parasiticus]|uniref:DC-UbP/UBTD2 N-terminal domain-containing protein n=1 Tax=Tieghemiomyces parasiticus TaxID=78921 RepID=A0A9W8DQW2_9FUNG|nr:hypothetical protein IWQ60_006898 [Tieghemiomyces parasiticus]